MNTKIISISVITVLLLIGIACSASFTTANISSFNFGKNEKADPPTTTFNVGEKIFAVAVVANNMSKMKVSFKLIFENVEGKTKGEVAATKDLDVEGSGAPTFFFTAPIPGEYKVEAALIDEQGKEVDKKSGTVTVKGDAPAAPDADPGAATDDESKDKPS